MATVKINGEEYNVVDIKVRHARAIDKDTQGNKPYYVDLELDRLGVNACSVFNVMDLEEINDFDPEIAELIRGAQVLTIAQNKVTLLGVRWARLSEGGCRWLEQNA